MRFRPCRSCAPASWTAPSPSPSGHTPPSSCGPWARKRLSALLGKVCIYTCDVTEKTDSDLPPSGIMWVLSRAAVESWVEARWVVTAFFRF